MCIHSGAGGVADSYSGSGINAESWLMVRIGRAETFILVTILYVVGYVSSTPFSPLYSFMG